MHRSLRYLPEFLAVAVTLLNAVKPAVVDDTAYLLFARHLAADPTHPYAFTLFWYDAPDPAMEILLPPVVPMWLAAGIALLGENLVALKLWLLPFLWLFTRSIWYLLGTFAPREQVRGSVLLAFSPAVLPLVNFMLDIPAVACGLAGTAFLVHARRSSRSGWLVMSMALGAAAAQSKYTMIVLPAVWCWYGLTHRYLARSLVACAGGTILFAAWELFVTRQCGESHFCHHVQQQQAGEAGQVAFWGKLEHWFGVKGGLVVPMLGYFGGLAVGWGLYAGPAVGFSRRLNHAVALVAGIGLVAIVVLPAHTQTFSREPNGSLDLTLPDVVFVGLGAATTVTITAVLGHFLVRRAGPRRGWRRNPTAWFLAGWLAIEVGGMFGMTPFPAARRIVMPAVVVGFLACAWVSRSGRIPGRARPTRSAVAFGLAAGLGLYALDTWDALAERDTARAAVESILPTPGRLWTQGHWGWQYAMDRAGAQLVVPGVSQLKKGDWLVLPVPPDDGGFYRPYHGGAVFARDESRTRFVRRLVRDDAISGATIPTLYGGRYPFTGRDHPRLVVDIYRVTADWVPQPPVLR